MFTFEHFKIDDVSWRYGFDEHILFGIDILVLLYHLSEKPCSVYIFFHFYKQNMMITYRIKGMNGCY